MQPSPSVSRGTVRQWWSAPVAFCLSLLGLATAGAGQTNWVLRSMPTVPPARLDSGLAFDVLRGCTVMFGGGNGVNGLSDTWEWDGTNWLQRFPAASPSPRESVRLAYDSARGRTVLCGGLGAGALNDTWEWDGTTWLQRTSASNPSPRYYHAMAYDAARAETVLFGGYSGGYAGDTWVWNGISWTQRFPANSPGPRTQMAMAYDPLRQRIVAFGGRSSSTNYPGSTWEWDGTNWNQASPVQSPPPRESAAMAYDTLRERVILFGGNTAANVRLNDTWEWDGSDWVQRSPLLAPAPVRYHAMAFDAARARAVEFGGLTTTVLNQTWEYFHPAPATYVSFGSGCQGTAGTPVLAPAPNDLPWLGGSFEVRVSNAPPLAIALLAWGLSNTATGALPLPLNLGVLGAPLCSLLVDPAATPAIVTDFLGQGVIVRNFPPTPSLVAIHFYDQFGVLDAGANALGLAFSQASDACLALK